MSAVCNRLRDTVRVIERDGNKPPMSFVWWAQSNLDDGTYVVWYDAAYDSFAYSKLKVDGRWPE